MSVYVEHCYNTYQPSQFTNKNSNISGYELVDYMMSSCRGAVDFYLLLLLLLHQPSFSFFPLCLLSLKHTRITSPLPTTSAVHLVPGTAEEKQVASSFQNFSASTWCSGINIINTEFCLQS